MTQDLYYSVRFSPDLQGEVTYNDSKVAGRAVKRRRIERSDIRSWIDRHSYPPLQEETSRTKNLIIEYQLFPDHETEGPLVD